LLDGQATTVFDDPNRDALQIANIRRRLGSAPPSANGAVDLN